MVVVRTVACSSCGAPISASRFARSAVCRHCGATVFIDPDAVERARFREAFATWNEPATHGFADARCVRVGGRAWALQRLLAHGRSADVHAATLARRPTERAIVKLARDDSGAARLDREHRWLAALQRSSVNGAEHFTLRVPQPIACGPVDGGAQAGRRALVLRWASGFFTSLTDVRALFHAGVDPRAGVWMWRRALETLAFAHRSGVAHGGVTPARLLVHPREHGVMLVGWGDALDASDATRAADIAACARAIAFAIAAAPAPLAELLAEVERTPERHLDAWVLHERVAEVARACFGAPRFEPFVLPGW